MLSENADEETAKNVDRQSTGREKNATGTLSRSTKEISGYTSCGSADCYPYQHQGKLTRAEWRRASRRSISRMTELRRDHDVRRCVPGYIGGP